MRKFILRNLHRRLVGDARSRDIVRFRKFRADPARIQAPDVPKDLNKASFSQLKQRAVDLMATLRRFSDSSRLHSDDRHLAEDRADYIQDMLGAHPLRDDLVRTIMETETGTLLPRIERLMEHSQVEKLNGV